MNNKRLGEALRLEGNVDPVKRLGIFVCGKLDLKGGVILRVDVLPYAVDIALMRVVLKGEALRILCRPALRCHDPYRKLIEIAVNVF